MLNLVVKGFDERGVTDSYANLSNGVCFFCYATAAMSLHIHLFIAAERGGLDERYLSAAPVLLGVAGGFLGLGAIFHVFFYWWNPERFQNRAFCLGVLFFAGVLAMSSGKTVLLSHTTLSPGAIEATSGAAWMVYVAVWLAHLLAQRYASAERSTCNRMARHIQYGDFLSAVAAGRIQPEHKRDLATHYNLAVAYTNLGMLDKARMHLDLAEQTPEVPVNVSREAFEQSIAELRKAAACTMERLESTEEGMQA